MWVPVYLSCGSMTLQELEIRILKLMECGNWISLQEIHVLLEVKQGSGIFPILYHSPETFQIRPHHGFNPEFKLLKPTCDHPECNIRVVLES